MSKTYSIFGAGAAGLYTAWRLLGAKITSSLRSSHQAKSKQLAKGDTLELYDWGRHDFSAQNPGPQNPGTWHYGENPDNSYVELGGMHYLNWDTTQQNPNGGFAPGHRLVSTVIAQLGLHGQLGSSGFAYSDADYSSNFTNGNTAAAFEANNEFTPGNQYMTITTGYSGMLTALFAAIQTLAKRKRVHFRFYPNTRLYSILAKDDGIHYTFAERANPWKPTGTRITNAAWLALRPHSLDLVARATGYRQSGGLDVLNHQKVQFYLESAIMQPSCKVGMFFHTPWWTSSTHPAHLTSCVVTPTVVAELKKQKFPQKALNVLPAFYNANPFASHTALFQALEAITQERLTISQQDALSAAASRNTMGPCKTDTPIRQAVYFGNNAKKQSDKPVYGILASYDDESFIGPNEQKQLPSSDNHPPLVGPRKVPARMVKMLRKQLAELHYGPNSDYSDVPEPLEAAYIDGSLPPFNARCHAWAAHINIADVQQKIRKPSQLIEGADANIFIVGEAYSNDQAWVEGAYCTAESVLNDFFGIEPLIDNCHYPFICKLV